MSPHPPKSVSSIEGLGIDTIKLMRRINEHVSIGTETWTEMKEPWTEGSTIIAGPGYTWTTKWEVGKPYIITKFRDEADSLIAIYCDIARPVQKVEGGFTFVDLYLDVWMIVGQEPVVLDKDELEDAVSANYITKDEAKRATEIAEDLIVNLNNSQKFLDF